ncbi:MAG TPA: PqqD family protein [Chloroflexia bacterium]|nr:PqqD family protein [Chloroflexia bacterium]
MSDIASFYADDTTIAAAADQASVDLDDEAAILNLKTGIYFGLNEVGAWIWRLIEEPKMVAAIRAAVLAEFDVEPETCQRDLQSLLRDLEQNQLIDVRPAGTP